MIAAAVVTIGRAPEAPNLPVPTVQTAATQTATPDTRWTIPAILAEAEWMDKQGNALTPPPFHCVSLHPDAIQDANTRCQQVRHAFQTAVHNTPYPNLPRSTPQPGSWRYDAEVEQNRRNRERFATQAGYHVRTTLQQAFQSLAANQSELQNRISDLNRQLAPSDEVIEDLEHKEARLRQELADSCRYLQNVGIAIEHYRHLADNWTFNIPATPVDTEHRWFDDFVAEHSDQILADVPPDSTYLQDERRAAQYARRVTEMSLTHETLFPHPCHATLLYIATELKRRARLELTEGHIGHLQSFAAEHQQALSEITEPTIDLAAAIAVRYDLYDRQLQISRDLDLTYGFTDQAGTDTRPTSAHPQTQELQLVAVNSRSSEYCQDLSVPETDNLAPRPAGEPTIRSFETLTQQDGMAGAFTAYCQTGGSVFVNDAMQPATHPIRVYPDEIITASRCDLYPQTDPSQPTKLSSP